MSAFLEGWRSALFVCIAGFCLSHVYPAKAEKPFTFATTPGKLPKTVVPSAYRLDLIADPDALRFSGTLEIDVAASTATDTVTLDAVDLTFASVTLKGETLPPAKVTLDVKAETATFHFAKKLAAGPHTLVIAYSGQIPETPAGFYYNDYDTPKGKQRMLVTQFEATDARRMLPSWDEPVFKATFDLAVTLPKDLAVVSNTPATSETEITGGLKKTVFGQTPRMSTYLLALCAGHLERIHDASTGTDIGVWAIEGKAEQGRGALEAAIKILAYYNDYFGVPYPLPKLDLIAVPGNFAAGAMENWGAITFIDNVLLFDPASSSEATRQAIYLVVAHEMAHQWSGDLVTMAWWNDLWLNEGFAEWMNFKATDALNPDWQFWLRAHEAKESAFSIDARSTTHPIQVPIDNEHAIGSAFDRISYEKGALFLRMIETYLTPDVFRDGMRRYMKAHQYSNATTADLWAELGAASGKPVASIAAGFTEQPGVPLIDVTTQCRDGQMMATLTQERFTINDPRAAKLKWQVPVQVAAIGSTAPAQTILVNGKANVSFPGCDHPLKANFDDVGYFRTQYDATTLAALTKIFKTLTPADRVNLLSDEWALVQAGRTEIAAYLDLTRQLSNETTLVVWNGVLDSFDEIDDLERDTPEQAAFRHYAIGLLAPEFARVGWDAKPGEDGQTRLLRARLITTLGRFGDPAVIEEAKKRFTAFLADPATLAPDLRDPVARIIGLTGDKTAFDQLHTLGKNASSTEDKLRYFYALAGTHDPALIDQAADLATTNELPNGRVGRFLGVLAQRSEHPDLVWKKTVAIRGKVLPKLPEEFRAALLPLIASTSTNPDIARELKAMPEASSTGVGAIETAKALEKIQGRASFKAKLTPALGRWLQDAGS
jgi:aminopeptidase N